MASAAITNSAHPRSGFGGLRAGCGATGRVHGTAAARSLFLTARQRQAAELAAEGLTNKEIARGLGISPSVAKKHVERAMRRLGVNRRAAIGRRLV